MFGRSPKIAVPILTQVALRAIAVSKLADMPLARRCSRDTARRMDDVNGPNALGTPLTQIHARARDAGYGCDGDATV